MVAAKAMGVMAVVAALALLAVLAVVQLAAAGERSAAAAAASAGAAAAAAGGRRAATARALLVHHSHGDDDDDDDDDDGSSKCDATKAVKHLYGAMEKGDARRAAAAFHRTAIRYDNGHLYEPTNGLPLSEEQLKCVMRRVDVRMEPKGMHDGAGADGRFVGVQWDMYVDDVPSAVKGYSSYEFDDDSCTVSVARHYYDANHAAVAKLYARAAEDCLGDTVDGGAPGDDVSTVLACWDHLARGDAPRLAACYADDARVVSNGRTVSRAELQVPALRALFATARYNTPEVLSVVKRNRENRVGLLVAGTYTLVDDDDSNDEAETFPFYVGQMVRVEDGKLSDVVSVSSPSAPLEQALLGDAPPPTRDALAFANAPVVNTYPDLRKHLGDPTLVANVAGGFALWEKATIAQKANRCFDSVMLVDELIDVPPAVGGGLDMHPAFVVVRVPFAVDASMRDAVHSLSPSISYDAVKKHIIATEANLGFAVAAAWTAARVANGDISAERAISGYAEILKNTVQMTAAGNIRLNDDGTTLYSDEFFSYNARLCNLIQEQR